MVLVTGGTGFIGSHVVRELILRNMRVRVLLRKKAVTKNIQGLPIEVAYGDLLHLDSLRSALRGVKHVFHVAALFSFWPARKDFIFKVNVDGTRNLMEAAMQEGVNRVIYTSTVAAIGATRDPSSPVKEEWEFNLGFTKDPYVLSKKAAEEVVMEYVRKGLDVVIVNPSGAIGPGDIRPTPTGRLLLSFLNGELPGYIHGGGNLADVRDIARGHLLAFERGRPGQRYILGGENLFIHETLHLFSKATGLSAPRLRIPYPVAWLYALYEEVYSFVFRREPLLTRATLRGSRFYLFCSSEKAEKELGYKRSDLTPAVKEAASWFLRNGYIKQRRVSALEHLLS